MYVYISYVLDKFLMHFGRTYYCSVYFL